MRYLFCLMLLGCHYGGDVGGLDTDVEGTDPWHLDAVFVGPWDTEEPEALADCEEGIAEWYARGCLLDCPQCSWSASGEAPLSVEQAQALCEAWSSPDCIEYLEEMLDCWEPKLQAGAMCPGPCPTDAGLPLLIALDGC